MPTTTSPPGAPTRANTRVAALDGLRGLALLGMLAWHAQVGWVKGGFARMTIFFVLSGYLAAASWLSLRRRGEPHPFGTFWRRRVRRLVPLTVLGVALGVAVTAWIGSEGAIRDLRGDATSVVTGMSNWRFLANGQSYGELFERPSAFQHFWSLSLEEQCFWLLPLVLAGAAWVGRRHAWALVLAAATALAAIPAVVPHSPDAAYYGTHVRGGEFLVGVTLALVLERSGGRVPDRWHRPVQGAGALSLTALLVVMLTVDRNLPWLYQGGLGLFAIPAVLVVAACRAGRGPATVALSLAPLAMLGRAAFSIYALHWPLFQIMTPERTGLRGGWLALAQLAVGIGVGLAVYRFVERPLLDAHRAPRSALGLWWATDRRALPLLAGATVVVVVAALAVPRPPAPYDLQVLEARLSNGHDLDLDQARQVLEATPVLATSPIERLRQPEVRFGLFGGSTAVSLGAVGRPWAERSETLDLAPGYARLGCGLITEGLRTYGRTPDGVAEQAPPDDHCLGWQTRWPAVAASQDLDLAVVMTGVWETSDWSIGTPPVDYRAGDPGFDLLVATHLHEAVDVLEARGTAVVLVTTPLIGHGRNGMVHDLRNLGPDHAARVARFNEILRQVAAEHPHVAVIDYGAYVDEWSDEQTADRLPDGIHPTEAAGANMWDEFLGPELERVVATLRGDDELAPSAAAEPATGPPADLPDEPVRGPGQEPASRPGPAPAPVPRVDTETPLQAARSG